jgi:hypothetical protein
MNYTILNNNTNTSTCQQSSIDASHDRRTSRDNRYRTDKGDEYYRNSGAQDNNRLIRNRLYHQKEGGQGSEVPDKRTVLPRRETRREIATGNLLNAISGQPQVFHKESSTCYNSVR